MTMQADRDEQVIVSESMIVFGGGFVQQLGRLLLRADLINANVIKSAWPGYWTQYKKLAEARKEELEMVSTRSYTSEYIKAEEVKVGVAVLIINEPDYGDIDGDKVLNGRVTFKGEERGLTFNKTNTKILANAWGEDTKEWKDKNVLLSVVDVTFHGKPVKGIRMAPGGEILTADK